MGNSKYLLTLLLLVVIGVFIGVIAFRISNSKSNDDFSLANISQSSGNKLNDSSNITNNTSGDTNGVSIETTSKFKPENIKAVYLTGWTTGSTNKRKTIIEDLNKHGFNAVVIDIKDESGQVTYNSNVQTAMDISSSTKMISDMQAVIDDFHAANIYVIGRIVTFKDPIYAKNIPDIAYKNIDGTLWKDFAGNNWPNPYNESSWDYPILLAKEAAEYGLDEIQFDYIRFPSSEGKTKNISFGFDSNTKTKSEVINTFLIKVKDELKDYDVVISADVFGITTKKKGDFENIGQDFYEISKIVDVICPMVYPSHYGTGEYGIKAPDKEPYKIIYGSLKDAQKQYLAESGDSKFATIRPYLQDFTASWLKKGNYINYGTTAVTAQLQACYDLNVHDFTLWDPSNKYAYESLNNIIKKISGDILNSGDIINLKVNN